MDFSEINPFLRFAQLQPTIIEGNRYKAAYDYRIFYILSGTATFLIEEQQIILHPGTILFFRPGIFYRFIGEMQEEATRELPVDVSILKQSENLDDEPNSA